MRRAIGSPISAWPNFTPSRLTNRRVRHPPFMSPEQASGQRRARSSHRCITRATLYELAAMEPIFGDRINRNCCGKSFTTNRVPRSVEPKVPVELETIILKAVARTRRIATVRPAGAPTIYNATSTTNRSRRNAPVWLSACKWARRHPRSSRYRAVCSAPSVSHRTPSQSLERKSVPRSGATLSPGPAPANEYSSRGRVANNPDANLRRQLLGRRNHFQELIELRGDPDAQTVSRYTVRSKILSVSRCCKAGHLHLLKNRCSTISVWPGWIARKNS